MDARSLFLTANSTTIYVFMCLDLEKDRWSWTCRRAFSALSTMRIFAG